MDYTFDGVAKRIYLPLGATVLDLQDLYSRWKDWVRTNLNAGYALAMYTVGGEIVEIPLYVFLQNGWYIVPQPADHVLDITQGVLIGNNGTDPIEDPAGDYQIHVNKQAPGIAIGYSTSGSTITVSQIADEIMVRIKAEKYLKLNQYLGLK